MPIIPVTSVDDPQIAVYRALPKSQLAVELGLFIAEGDKVAEQMFASRFQPHSMLVEEESLERFAALAEPELPIYVVSRKLMSQTVGFKFHRGVMGCGIRGPWPKLCEVIPPFSQPCLLAVCPELHDPTNLGTLVRTSLALGVDALLLGPHGADPLSRRVIRVSMGAALRLPIVVAEPREALQQLREEYGIELCATVLDSAATPLDTFRRAARTALLFGSEGHGLPRDIVSFCQRQITIPMPPGTDSLNAAVAAGICLYYVSRGGGSGKEFDS